MTVSVHQDLDLSATRVIHAPLASVWNAWTDPASFEQWWIPAPQICRVRDMDLRPGGAFRLDFMHAELTPQAEPTPERFKGLDKGHHFTGTILACEPPRLLSHTFGDREVPSEVTYELTPEGRDTRLVLTHRRLPDRAQMQNVTTTNVQTLVGINSNYDDTATFDNIVASYSVKICERYEGNDDGDEPVSLGSGPDPVHCLYEASDIHLP